MSVVGDCPEVGTDDFEEWLSGKPTPPPTPKPAVPFVMPVDREDEQRRAWSYIEGIAGRQAMLTAGSRNDALNRGAYRAFRTALGAGITLEQVEDVMYRANVLNGQVADDGERQVRRTLASARASAERDGAEYLDPPSGTPPAFTIERGNTTFDPVVPNDAPVIAYTDFAALLSGGLPEPPKPTVLQRDDGAAIFYPRKRNELYGDPEDGKTMLALAAAVGELRNGGRGLFLDFDNNGPAETAGRLLMLGAGPAVLADPNRFRHIEPGDAAEVRAVVADCAGWATLVIGDCVGELLPLFRASSDSADDYTRVMQMVSSPLEHGGAAVIWLDHQAKSTDSRNYGAGGTMAKRRAVSGVSINLVRKSNFVPGAGGAAELWINKDRPGGLRAHCPKGEGRRQFAGTFILDPPGADGVAAWRVAADRSAVPAAVTVDPVVERHYVAAVALAGEGRPATATAVAAHAHGLPADVAPTQNQKVAARRYLEQLASGGRLARVAGSSPVEWAATE